MGQLRDQWCAGMSKRGEESQQGRPAGHTDGQVTYSFTAWRTSLPRAKAGAAANRAGKPTSSATADLQGASGRVQRVAAGHELSCCVLQLYDWTQCLRSTQNGRLTTPHLRLTACSGSSAAARTTTADRARLGAATAPAAQGFRVLAAAICMVSSLLERAKVGWW